MNYNDLYLVSKVLGYFCRMSPSAKRVMVHILRQAVKGLDEDAKNNSPAAGEGDPSIIAD